MTPRPRTSITAHDYRLEIRPNVFLVAVLHHSLPPAMSNETQRADQIAHRLYSKLSLVVNHARATLEPPPTAKVDKWVSSIVPHMQMYIVTGSLSLQFNLETPDPELFKEHTRIYRSISTSHVVPLFQLQVLLCVPELATNQVLVYVAPDSSRVRINPTPRYIVLESWNLEYVQHQDIGHQAQDVAPSTMYKHGIPLFRSIFTLLRVLPAWKLARRLRRRVGGNRNGNFSIQLRVHGHDGAVRVDEVLSLGEYDTSVSYRLSPHPPPQTSAHASRVHVRLVVPIPFWCIWVVCSATTMTDLIDDSPIFLMLRCSSSRAGPCPEEGKTLVVPHHASHGRPCRVRRVLNVAQLSVGHPGVPPLLALPRRRPRLHPHTH